MNGIIAVIFDFDDTLARDSTTDFLASLGIDTKTFWGKEVAGFLEEGWDPVPAYMYGMLEWSKRQSSAGRITRRKIEEFGGKVRIFDGVQKLFGRLRDHVSEIDPAFSLEYYIISSGLGDLIGNSKIAGHLSDVFASDFHYGGEGEILFPKRIVSFTDKTRYIFQISKGFVGDAYRNKPFEVNRRIDSGRLRIPMNRMIFIGDGFTDIPCFSLLNKNGGTSFAVYDKENREKKQRAWGFIEDGRVKTLHSANYSRNSDLVGAIEMSLASIIAKTKTEHPA